MRSLLRLKKPKTKRSTRSPFRDILQITRWLSSSSVPEKVIETILTDLHERLGKRSRCALFEGDDLRLRFWAGEHNCPIGGLTVDKESIVWDVVRKGAALNLTTLDRRRATSTAWLNRSRSSPSSP